MRWVLAGPSPRLLRSILPMASPRVSKTPRLSAEHLAEILLVLGTALIIYWQPLSQRIALKISDGVFVIAIGLWILFVTREKPEWVVKSADVWFIPPLLVSILVATLMGYVHYRLGMSRNGVILLGRLLTCIALFLAVYSLALRDRSFRRWVSLAFLSPLALLLAMVIPNVSATMWDGNTGRFQGLTVNANTAAVAFLIAFALAYTLAAYEAGMKRRLRALGFLGVALGMLAFILLTQSRAYVVATFASTLIGTALVAAHHRVSKVKFAFLALSGVAVIVSGILVIGPSQSSLPYLARISPAYYMQRLRAEHQTPQRSGAPPQTNVFQRFLNGIIPTIEGDTRMSAIRYYSHVLSTDYLGLGLNYETKFTVLDPPTGTRHGANTILDLPIYGGVGAVLSVAYLALLVGRRTKLNLRLAINDNVPYTIGAVTALGGLWVAAFLVGSPLFDYQFWILTAIALT